MAPKQILQSVFPFSPSVRSGLHKGGAERIIVKRKNLLIQGIFKFRKELCMYFYLFYSGFLLIFTTHF